MHTLCRRGSQHCRHLSLHTQLLRAPSNQGRPRAPHQAQPATWQRTPSSSSATGAYSGGGYGSAPPCPYLRPGRYAPVDLGSPISLPVGRSSSGTGSLTAQLNVTFPSGAGKAPLVLLSAGFLLQSNMYKSYATGGNRPAAMLRALRAPRRHCCLSARCCFSEPLSRTHHVSLPAPRVPSA